MSMNDLEQMAIERLKAASDMSLMAYEKPLVICISGGKDSGVITELAVRSGIPCELQHNHITADAPETVTGADKYGGFSMSKAKMYGCFRPVKRNCTPPKWGKVPRGNKGKQKGNAK